MITRSATTTGDDVVQSANPESRFVQTAPHLAIGLSAAMGSLKCDKEIIFWQRMRFPRGLPFVSPAHDGGREFSLPFLFGPNRVISISFATQFSAQKGIPLQSKF